MTMLSDTEIRRLPFGRRPNPAAGLTRSDRGESWTWIAFPGSEEVRKRRVSAAQWEKLWALALSTFDALDDPDDEVPTKRARQAAGSLVLELAKSGYVAPDLIAPDGRGGIAIEWVDREALRRSLHIEESRLGLFLVEIASREPDVWQFQRVQIG